MLSTMQRQQADMRLTLRDSEAFLVKAGEIDAHQITLIRPRLILQLKAYTKFKHTVVFPALLASPDPLVIQLALQMRSRCDAMVDFYRGYLTEWPAARVFEQPALYRGVALDVIGRLRQHFSREEADVVRLTDRISPKLALVAERPAGPQGRLSFGSGAGSPSAAPF